MFWRQDVHLHWAIELSALWLVGIKVHGETKTQAFAEGVRATTQRSGRLSGRASAAYSEL